jgi:hypothetical protein
VVVASIRFASIAVIVSEDTAFVDNNDRFLALGFLRGQLDEIHERINNDLLGKVNKKYFGTDLAIGTSKTVYCRIRVTNVGTKTPKYVVEEISSLKSAVLALGETIDYIRSKIPMEPLEEEQPK